MKSCSYQRRAMRKFNLCSHLAMPICSGGIRGTGQNFIDSYLLRDQPHIIKVFKYDDSCDVVHLSEYGKPIPNDKYAGYYGQYGVPLDYVDRYYIDGRLYIILDYSVFPGVYKNMLIALDGKYSMLEEWAVENIVNRTVLPYKSINSEGQVITDRRLIACSKNPKERENLRIVLNEELGISLPLNAELYSKIPEDNYVNSIIEVIRMYTPDFADDVQKFSPKFEPELV